MTRFSWIERRTLAFGCGRVSLVVLVAFLSSSGVAGYVGAETSPPMAVHRDIRAWVDDFETLEDGITLIQGSEAEQSSYPGRLNNAVKSVTTPLGQGLLFSGDGRVAYAEPMMIDPREGTLIIDVALDVDLQSDDASPIIEVWNLSGSDGDRHYMARVWIASRPRNLLFGVYDRTDRTWLMMLKAPIRWEPGEPHRVAVTWRHKTSLFVDGRLEAVRLSDGLFTDVFSYPPIDMSGSTLYLGPRRVNQTIGSGFTVNRLEVYDQQIRLDQSRLLIQKP